MLAIESCFVSLRHSRCLLCVYQCTFCPAVSRCTSTPPPIPFSLAMLFAWSTLLPITVSIPAESQKPSRPLRVAAATTLYWSLAPRLCTTGRMSVMQVIYIHLYICKLHNELQFEILAIHKTFLVTFPNIKAHMESKRKSKDIFNYKSLSKCRQIYKEGSVRWLKNRARPRFDSWTVSFLTYV